MSSATTASEKPLSFMEKLNPLISVYRPSEVSTSNTNTTRQLRLIIIASWTGAKDAHIAKYVVKYQSMYPAAQILLLKSTMSCMFQPSQISPAMKDATPIIRAAMQPVVSSSSSSPPLLIHMLSNGGSSSLANLYEQYSATAGPNGNDKRLPPHVTIYDSCPGLFRLPRVVAFTSVGLSSLQQLIAAPFMYALAAVWSVAITLSIFPNSLGDWYKSHNNDAANAAEVRRVYIYSRTDALIDLQDVEAHAAEAETKGFSVALEKYEGSAHVAHLRKDESRYWEIVRRTVEG
ncbi:hypothetical protein KVR01_012220 [Diaporthe batatas]|uniref:uncharacterized protein n=1 Tax=Diaporthe batatas TaxID=748121 RepID=UPI001D04FA7E|nr:uncharacterized protein KVR01_012220 [Diaporthe batatas]KAG8157948.1 hypothetical protein KVR01_012220 [Diaporthe batatas]